MAFKFGPVALIVLDGFGIAPPNEANAVSLAKKPFWNTLIKNYPLNLLEASSLNVGLPQGEFGNSEVGHVTIGSGILKYQSLPRISRSIAKGEFFNLPALKNAIKRAKKTNCKIHVIGLIGNGGVHSHQEHLEALLSLLKKSKVHKNTYIHTFLDGRDTAKDNGIVFMDDLLKFAQKSKIAGIASLCGRYYAMDRNQNWDRTAKAYQAIVNGQADKKGDDPIEAIKQSYKKKIYDEEFEPTVFVNGSGKARAIINDNDIIIFFNFRADRARQLSEALIDPKFSQFKTKKIKNLHLITFTEYKKGLPAEVLFSPELIKNPLAKIFSGLNLKQLHIAETEKYAHVTFFMNGMVEKKFKGEDRILIPSPDVSSYDKKPEMSAEQVTIEILKSVKAGHHDFLAVNYANPDMVGHTGNLQATIKAIEAVDSALSRIVPEIIKKGGRCFIVGDHGNAEELINPITGEIDKEHNIYPVPFMVISNELAEQPNSGIIDNDPSVLTPIGILADVAPTLLTLSGIKPPKDMTGQSLF